MDFTEALQIFCHSVCARILQSGKWKRCLYTPATPNSSSLLHAPLSVYSCHQRHSNLSFASFFIMRRRLKQHDVFIFVVFILRAPCALSCVPCTGVRRWAPAGRTHPPPSAPYPPLSAGAQRSARGLFAFVNM